MIYLFTFFFCFEICKLSLCYKLSIGFEQPVTLCQEKQQKDTPLLLLFLMWRFSLSSLFCSALSLLLLWFTILVEYSYCNDFVGIRIHLYNCPNIIYSRCRKLQFWDPCCQKVHPASKVPKLQNCTGKNLASYCLPRHFNHAFRCKIELSVCSFSSCL